MSGLSLVAPDGGKQETREERILRCAEVFVQTLEGAEIDVAEPAGSALRALRIAVETPK